MVEIEEEEERQEETKVPSIEWNCIKNGAIIPYLMAATCFMVVGFQFTENFSEKFIFFDFAQYLNQGKSQTIKENKQFD